MCSEDSTVVPQHDYVGVIGTWPRERFGRRGGENQTSHNTCGNHHPLVCCWPTFSQSSCTSSKARLFTHARMLIDPPAPARIDTPQPRDPLRSPRLLLTMSSPPLLCLRCARIKILPARGTPVLQLRRGHPSECGPAAVARRQSRADEWQPNRVKEPRQPRTDLTRYKKRSTTLFSCVPHSFVENKKGVSLLSVAPLRENGSSTVPVPNVT